MKNRRFLFYQTHDYGKMKPCRVQRKSSLVFPCQSLHGFSPFKRQKHPFYKDKVLWTRKHTDSCTPQALHRYLFLFQGKHCNGCTEQRQMMTAGKQAPSYCLATFWREWHLQPEREKASADRSHFPPVRHSIPKSNFPRNGTWAGSACATCWQHLRIWGLSTLIVQGWHP